jgi:hypothetical protein
MSRLSWQNAFVFWKLWVQIQALTVAALNVCGFPQSLLKLNRDLFLPYSFEHKSRGRYIKCAEKPFLFPGPF